MIELLFLVIFLNDCDGGILILALIICFLDCLVTCDRFTEHRSLQCEAVSNLHFIPNYDSCRIQLVLVLFKQTRLPVENLLDTSEDFWQ